MIKKQLTSASKVKGQEAEQRSNNIKNTLNQQSAGFPSMIDIGFQGHGLSSQDQNLSKQTTASKWPFRKNKESSGANKNTSFKDIEVISSDEKMGNHEQPHEEEKKDTLLIIGFDDKPKGVNPL